MNSMCIAISCTGSLSTIKYPEFLVKKSLCEDKMGHTVSLIVAEWTQSVGALKE